MHGVSEVLKGVIAINDGRRSGFEFCCGGKHLEACGHVDVHIPEWTCGVYDDSLLIRLS